MFVAKLKASALFLFVAGVIAAAGTTIIASGARTHDRSDLPAATVETTAEAQAQGRAKTTEEQTPSRPGKDGIQVVGTLLAVEADKQTVTLSTFNRQTGKSEKTYPVAKDVVVLRNDKPAKLHDLKKDGHVTVKLSADQKTAVSISEVGKTAMLPLKSVDAAKNAVTVTVTTSARGKNLPEKKDVTYALEKDATVMFEGKAAKLDDLKDLRLGSSLQLTFSADDDTKLIRVQYSVRGR